jgi:16S rRNA (cytidine1402-2'-O)-methyltransferase
LGDVTSRGGRLLVVATPLGNLADMTSRAVEALGRADLVACEDTRRTRALLSHLGLRKRTLSCHKLNEASRVATVLECLLQGGVVALVSDAGTPALSDPGARVVAAVREAGLTVEAVPGPSAPAAAISVSGFESGGFLFAGYPPAGRVARRRFLGALREAERARASADPKAGPWPLVLFEAPHRIAACLHDLAEMIGDRRVVILRELTKMHEETLQGTVLSVLAELRGRPRKGEFTLVVQGGGREEPAPRSVSGPDLKKAYEDLIVTGLERREALKRLSIESGLSRREVYRALLEAEERD